MEYLVIVGIAFVFIAAVTAIAYAQTRSFQSDITAAQVQKIGNRIIDAADAVAYKGPPSRREFKLYFPEGISDINITGQTITFTIVADGGPSEYELRAAANLTGSLRPFNGLHTITVAALNDSVNITDG
jgi:hypothetical protein